MPLDLERLRHNATALGQSRRAIGKLSGAMDLVRTHLEEIERLKAQGVTWNDIAAALAEQGVRRRDGGPITGRRLTGLIDSIRRQDAKRRKAGTRRIARADLAETPPIGSTPPSGASVPRSPLTASKPPAENTTPTPVHRTAEQLRRDGLVDLYDMLKAKKP